MTITNIKSGLVSAGLMALVAVLTFVLQGGNVFALDWRATANIAIIAFLTGLVSVIKNAGTTPAGTFGGIKVRD